MTRVSVWHGSIGEADADVLVNASNTLLRLGSGVSHAIRQACGPGFQDALDELLAAEHGGSVSPGSVVITSAHRHPRARHVAHVAVMDYRAGADVVPRPDEARLCAGYDALFAALASLPGGPRSVALVALGAGTGGFGLRRSVELACESLRRHLDRDASSLSHVLFVAYDALECANTFDTVRAFFEVDASTLSAEVRALLPEHLVRPPSA